MTTTYAQIHRLCCDYKYSGQARGNASKASWELYVVIYDTTDPWPKRRWPVARRHQVPTVVERTEALAELGYAPAPGAEWAWEETDGPACHGHPVVVGFLGTVNVVPLEQAPAAEGGEG